MELHESLVVSGAMGSSGKGMKHKEHENCYRITRIVILGFREVIEEV